MDKKIKARSSSHVKRTNLSNVLDQMVTGQQEKTFSHRTSRKGSQVSYSSQHGSKRTTSNTQNQNLDQDDEDVVEITDIKRQSADEVSEFINKLIAKNKISSKNAFDIPMIHLQQTKDFRSDLNENTWKNLSSTLENDYKIYGYRVDATHTITYKMVESIARHQANTSEAISDYKQQKEQQKKYKLDLVSTSLSKDYTGSLAKFIQKNVKLLNVTQLQSFFSYNPGLQRTKRKFDQQGLKALLLNNIEIKENGQLKLDQQHQQIKQSKIQSQEKNFNQILDCDQLFANISFQLENQQIGKCFQEVYQLNINQGGADSQQITKLLKLYRIVSGEERQEKKRKKKQQQVTLDLNLNAIPQENQTYHKNQGQIPMPMQIENSKNQNKQKNNGQNIQNQNNQCLNPQNNQIIQNIIEEELINLQTDAKKDEEKLQRMKKLNEGLKQMNLDQIQELPQHQNQHSRSEYSNQEGYQQKMRNIDQYISIKDKKEKKNRMRIKKDLTSQEIGKKLFNRKIKTKKNTDSEVQIQQPKKTNQKISFLQNKKTFKRGVVFKKSANEQKIFNKTKHGIKEKVQALHIQNVQKQDKKLKKKKKTQFDLPIYKIMNNQTNLIQDLDQFQQKSKDKKFVFSVIPSFIHQVKELKRQRLEQQRLKLLELQENQMITAQGQNILNECVQIQQLDILQMEDYMQKIRKTYQVTIKDTKDKMKQLLIKNQNLKTHTYDFRNLYQQYYLSQGFISPALCFLTVLHLANENNLQLEGNQDGENFNIRNVQNCSAQNSKHKEFPKIQQEKKIDQIELKKNKTKSLMNYQGSENSESMQVQG